MSLKGVEKGCLDNRRLWVVRYGRIEQCTVQEGLERNFDNVFLHLSSAWRSLSKDYAFGWHLDRVNEIEPCLKGRCSRPVHADSPRGIVDAHRTNFLHSGPWRPIVQSGRSLREMEFESCVKKVRSDLVSHDRSLIAPYELDLVSHRDRIAFEFNGDFWHSDENLIFRSGMKAWQYHRRKVEECERVGFSLAFVWESSWRQSRSAVMDAVCDFIQFRRYNQLLTAESEAPSPFLVTCEQNDLEAENLRRLKVQEKRFRQYRKRGV